MTKKVLSTIKELQSERPEDYRTFWAEFGKVLKEGLMRDFDNQETLLEISSFASTHSEDQLTTLAEYVGRMKEGQRQIFYATGESPQQILNTPHLEAFKAKGYEVLLLSDTVDEIWLGSVTEFDGKPLQSVAMGDVDLDSEEEKTAREAERKEQEKDFADLLAWLTETLERARQGSAAVHPPDRLAGLPDHRRLRHHAVAGPHLPGHRPGRPGRQTDFGAQSEPPADHRPAAGTQRPR